MAAPRVAAAPVRRPVPRHAPAPRRAPLRVVRPDPGVRLVGATGTLVVMAFFAILFVIAALHAMQVQTQARIDDRLAQNAALEEQIDQLHAELAWIESPDGIEQWAEANGLVTAPDTALLAMIPGGALPAPAAADPFGPDGVGG